MRTNSRGSIVVLVLLFSGIASAQANKDKDTGPILPNFVIKAQTVAVVIMPGVGEPVTNPNANRNAQLDVENALTKWGRLRPVLDAQDADLVMTVRKGTKGATPTVRGGGVDDAPVVLQPNGSDIRIGVQRGTPPSTTQTQYPEPKQPQLGTTAGNTEDLLEVYEGRTRYPLDGIMVWRYYGRDGLKAPEVRAVAEFRKAVERAIEQQKQSPQPNKP